LTGDDNGDDDRNDHIQGRLPGKIAREEDGDHDMIPPVVLSAPTPPSPETGNLLKNYGSLGRLPLGFRSY